jgi:hypothetical protein
VAILLIDDIDIGMGIGSDIGGDTGGDIDSDIGGDTGLSIRFPNSNSLYRRTSLLISSSPSAIAGITTAIVVILAAKVVARICVIYG